MSEIKSDKMVYVDLESRVAAIELPTNAVKVSLVITVYDDDKLETVHSELGFKEIQKAFKEAEDSLMGDDCVFTLSDEERKRLDG